MYLTFVLINYNQYALTALKNEISTWTKWLPFEKRLCREDFIESAIFELTNNEAKICTFVRYYYCLTLFIHFLLYLLIKFTFSRWVNEIRRWTFFLFQLNMQPPSQMKFGKITALTPQRTDRWHVIVPAKNQEDQRIRNRITIHKI